MTVFREVSGETLAVARPHYRSCPILLSRLATRSVGGVGAMTGIVDFLTLTQCVPKQQKQEESLSVDGLLLDGFALRSWLSVLRKIGDGEGRERDRG
jgi:hypothetical protein